MHRLASCALAFALVVGSTAWAQDRARRDEEKPPPPKPPTLTKPPELVEASAPVYPENALEAGLEADVKIRIHIDATGTVTRVEVVEPVGNGFDEAAVEAAEQYRFKPAEWDGVPGPIIVETTIHFKIEEKEEPEPPPPPAPVEHEEQGRDPAAVGPPSHGGDVRLPISLSGQAVERGTRRKLSGVIVSVSELAIDAVTDESGNFFFHGLPPGEYTILAAAEEYARFERKLTIKAKNERVDTRLWLRRKGSNPYETVVEGEREVLEVTKRTLERRQLTSVPGTFGDPIRVVQSLPGLARTPFVTGFLLIRGSNPDDSGVFIDGHRVPLIYHFLGGPSILNAEFLDRIELYPGGFPATYGRAIGGIVAVDTRATKSDGFHGSADIDLLDAGGYARVPIGENGSFAVAGRRSYLDFMLDFFLPEPDPGATLIVVPVYYDYQARFDYDFGSEGKASLFYISSSDQLKVVSEEADEEESLSLNTRIDFSRLIGSYKRPISGGLELTISPAFGRDKLVFSSGQSEDESPFTDIDITQTTLSYRMKLTGRLGKRFVIDSGIDLESRTNTYDLLAPLAGAEINQPISGQIDIPPEQTELIIDMFSYGLYLDLACDIGGHLRLVPGLRFDGYLLDGEARQMVDPRLVARYRIDDQWLAKGYIGQFHQPPQAEGFDSQFGNPDLSLERAIHYGVGGEWKPTKIWTIDAEVYYIDRYDLVHFTDEPELDEEAGRTIAIFNSGVSDTYGLELLVKREVTRNLYGWLSYTLSRSMQQRRP
ncbi:MAG: TonB-dependent receptor, partial [Proteobacteria bacterium]|nr:TonB-dependent receptor [Pseudomonadota bacterium]